MSNGKNNWGVRYSRIAWLEQIIRSHKNVECVKRDQDILFVIRRRKQNDELTILGCDEYAAGLEVVFRAFREFGEINIIHVGAGWCGYTKEAKEYCVSNEIGIFVSNEMAGALWRDDYWAYCKKDDRGDPIYYYRTRKS